MSATRVTATGHRLQAVPETTTALSQHFTNPSYLATPEDMPTWTQLPAVKGKDCDECAWLQHETQGRYGPRHKPRVRRGFTGGPVLYLCAVHAEAWHERDAADCSKRGGSPLSPIA